MLTVQGYSHTLGLGVSKAIPWKIKYFPDGILDCSDWISVSLHLHHADASQVKVRCRQSTVMMPITKETCMNSIEFPRFIKRDQLEGSTYLKDDCFSIRCDVDLAMGFRTQPTTQLVTVPTCGMAHQFGHILETGDGADVIFEVCREKFVAHRRLLAARSSENDATCLRIDNMDARVLKMMLYFIYTGMLPRIDDNEIREVAQDLFVAADRYDLRRLKLICTNMLCNCIDTVATTLAFAEQHGFDGLKKACFKFLASFSSLKAVRATDGFKKLKDIHPNILEELIVQG
ncbi:hypothetical protein ZWY2020_015384 [Hordeum vulgare]|nr:hypothetical protein ZWY2020_015384 [Hordeum vulgare]